MLVFPLECVVMSRNRHYPWIAASSVLLLSSSLMAAGCGNSTKAEAAPETTAAVPVIDVPVVKATTGDIESSLEISGTLAPRSRVAVKP